MPTRRRLPVLVVAASLAVVTPLMLSGCSLLPHLPGSSDKGGGITIPGVGSVGTGKLPKDYPTKDVPVIDGKIISGASIGGTDDHAWNITVAVTSLDDYDKIASLLTGAGLKADETATTSTDQTKTGLFTSDTYNVVVAVTKGDNDNPFIANYTVTKQKKQ